MRNEDRTCVTQGSLTCTGDDPKDGALYHVIPANDTKGSVLGPTNFPHRGRGSNPGPLAQEASALTTQLPRFRDFMIIFCFSCF